MTSDNRLPRRSAARPAAEPERWAPQITRGGSVGGSRSLDPGDEAWAGALVADHFGSSRVVSRGPLHQTTDLPSLVAYDGAEPVGLLHYRLDDAGDIEAVTLIAVEPFGTALLRALVEHARWRCNRGRA